MVEQDLPLEDAADSIERFMRLAQNGRTPSIEQVREGLDLAEALREGSGSDYDLPEPGDMVYDTDRGGRVPMEVVEVLDERSDEVTFDGTQYVSDANPYHPDDAPVVVTEYPDNRNEYYYPVTRLDW